MDRLDKLSLHCNPVDAPQDHRIRSECGANTPRASRQANSSSDDREALVGGSTSSSSGAYSHIALGLPPNGKQATATSGLPSLPAGATLASNSVSAAGTSALEAQGPPPSLLWPAFQSQYDWQAVHKDLEAGNYAGCYGWDNAAYWGIAEKKAGVDLKEWYKRRTKDEYYLPEFKGLIDNPQTQESWKDIFMFDPMGFYAHPPTIAACKANLDIPELGDLPRDGKIIREDGQVRTAKAAIYYTWNLPRLSERLEMEEDELRDALFKYSNNPDLKDKSKNVFIPGVGGCTIYTFGDVRKIRDPKTEICVRVHDECIGSDVFGSDICTCRPYLIFALQQCVMCAQRGGVGIVYNARENQSGGDLPEKYFNQTESIAGIRDARFQAMMPDALRCCSMSNEKYEAIVGAGIKVMQRVTLPEDYVKENMKVEINAKVASG